MNLENLDWFIIFGYLVCLILLSAYLSKDQKDLKDYFVASRKQKSKNLAISILATQCSTNSILGAPAFVAFSVGGGLGWLKYELAVPLSMIIIMIFIYPIFYRLKVISIYEYLEKRFDLKTRLLMSSLFLFVRVFATGVIVYSVSIIIELITGLSFVYSVLILGLITIIYDVLGGIKAIIYSDIIQMIILTSVLIFILFYLTSIFGGIRSMFDYFPDQRNINLNFFDYGLGDGKEFAFWPMLIGGFFLYLSYYGCDQSQMQKALCARNQDEGQKVFFLNGIFRFPLVLLYCLIGVGIGSYSQINSDFISSLPKQDGITNFNLAVPIFLIENLPTGIVGLTLVALFSAAMSSLDSVLNSLSAVTMEDFIKRNRNLRYLSEKNNLFISRVITLFWGSLAIILAFYVEDISSNVLIAINKIGSLINGPIIGVFALGILTKKINGNSACIGIICGFLFNLYCWLYLVNVSWLWWNAIGFVVTFKIALAHNFFFSKSQAKKTLFFSLKSFKKLNFNSTWKTMYIFLFIWSIFIFCLINFL